MIETIKQFFESRLVARESEPEQPVIDQIELASAVLLIEVMNSDHILDEREHEEIATVLKQTLSAAQEDLEEIIVLARSEAKQATSLYEFTKLINDSYSYEDKLVLIECMWRVAFADGSLDKYEDYLIRKVSELIYVSHSDFIRTKLKVKRTADGDETSF